MFYACRGDTTNSIQRPKTGAANRTMAVTIGEVGQFMLARAASFAKSEVVNQTAGMVNARTPINAIIPERKLMRARCRQIITAVVIVVAKPIKGTVARPVCPNPMRKHAMTPIQAELPSDPPNQPPAFHPG